MSIGALTFLLHGQFFHDTPLKYEIKTESNEPVAEIWGRGYFSIKEVELVSINSTASSLIRALELKVKSKSSY